jgi:hypothetical protein
MGKNRVLLGLLAGAALLSPATVLAADGPVFTLFGGTDLSVSGDVHKGAVSPIANLGPLNPALAGVSAELRIEPRDYGDIYGNANSLGLGVAWAMGNGQLFGNLRTTRASGGEVQVGGAFVPALNTTLPVYGRFGDYDAITLEGGYRQYFGNGNARPYLAGRVGATRVDAIDATFTIPAAAIALNNVAFYDSGWTMGVGMDAGIDWKVSESASLGLQVGIDYHGDLSDDDSAISGLGLSSINDTGSRTSYPVSLVWRMQF